MGCKFAAEPGQIESSVDLPHHVIFGNGIAKTKLVKQLTLVTLQTAHHGSTSPRIASTQRNHASRSVSTDFCNKIGDVSRIIAERGKSAILVTHDIGEAIAMADRVLVLSARPAIVRATHLIDLPRIGRDPVALRIDPAFQAHFAKIWADLEMPEQ
jgi:hypothetical protein